MSTIMLDHLCALSDALDTNCRSLPSVNVRATQDTVRTLRSAADSLCDAAERTSRGESSDAPQVAFAVSVAVLKIAEAGVLPDAVFGDRGAAYGVAKAAALPHL